MQLIYFYSYKKILKILKSRNCLPKLLFSKINLGAIFSSASKSSRSESEGSEQSGRSSSSSSSPSPSRSPSPSPARQAYIRFEDMGKDLKNALRVSILFVYLPNCILTDLCLTISLKLSG